MIVGERHLYRRRPGHASDDRVGLERTPREDDLVARIARDLHDFLAESDRPVACGDVLRFDVQLGGKCGDEFRRHDVRVAVDVCDGFRDLLTDARQRTLGSFVAGQLDRAWEVASRHVDGNGVEVGANASGHAQHYAPGIGYRFARVRR